jgi:hypothetical protein
MRQKNTAKTSFIAKYFLLGCMVWTVVLAGLFIWNFRSEIRKTDALVAYQARTYFQVIVSFRHWNARHGGVYVPTTETTHPNPYLDIPERDISTIDGLKLTLIDPAYMTRQIGEITSDGNHVSFRITSTNPLRPGNAPDAWERTALHMISTSKKEYSEYIDTAEGNRTFRYMAPLWVESSCLKCHAKQGYKVGDLRGGISVSLETRPIQNYLYRHIRHLSTAYLLIWVLGLSGILLGMIRLRAESRNRENMIVKLEDALSEVKKLSGFIPICASCKKIRDDRGYWKQVEAYIMEHSEAEFSHSICPKCARKLYAENSSNNS